VRVLTASGAGFLLAVLWFDLMFDVQAFRRGPTLPEEVVASVSGYYRRVTTDARPMNRLVALVMVVVAGSIVTELARGASPRWAWWASLALAGVPMIVAATHTLPSAVRLGSRADSLDAQSSLAHAILRDHVVCLVCIAGLLGVQLGTS
jgi:hypothetical protein